MLEATTSNASETTPQGTSASAAETADTATTEESTVGQVTERQETDSVESSEDAFDVKVNLDEVPKEYRGEVEKHVKNFEKTFKSAYTKKTQQTSAEVKAAREMADQAKAELQKTYSEIQVVLKDPKKYKAYQDLYGSAPQQAQDLDLNNLPPEVQTVGDALKYIEQRNVQRAASIEQSMEQKLTQKIAQKEVVERWDGALRELRADPKFKKYEKLVVRTLQDNTENAKYINMYRSGKSEVEVTKAAFDDFKAMLREDLEEVKKTTQQEYTKKATSTTSTPGKTFPTRSSAPASTDEIIARVRARLGQ